jgi:hypothetical protein
MPTAKTLSNHNHHTNAQVPLQQPLATTTTLQTPMNPPQLIKSTTRAIKRTKKKVINVEAKEHVARGLKFKGGLMGLVRGKFLGMMTLCQ